MKRLVECFCTSIVIVSLCAPIAIADDGSNLKLDLNELREKEGRVHQLDEEILDAARSDLSERQVDFVESEIEKNKNKSEALLYFLALTETGTDSNLSFENGTPPKRKDTACGFWCVTDDCTIILTDAARNETNYPGHCFGVWGFCACQYNDPPTPPVPPKPKPTPPTP